ncbi:MAG TPA: hypothetical protein VN755_12965 [Steroidobacteraceae bacterium]|nr:hypothetical protein [Steroidobacteraceae bacterium]
MKLCSHYRTANVWIRSFLRTYDAAKDDVLVVEKIASYGMAVGAEVFQTCVESGRFWQEWTRRDLLAYWMTRADVKLAICGQTRAKDANIRTALIDRFGGPEAIRKGGPLYKVAGDSWAALAIAVAWTDTQQPRESTGK